MSSEEKQGRWLDGKRCNATKLQRDSKAREIQARPQNGKVHKPNDAICEVTGRRHRVSPCRSAYYASPWRLLTLSLRRRRREAALLLLESWWHLTRWGSRPSHFMIITNTKRHHPNNMKTYQWPISEVITCLPRPYHNTTAVVPVLL